MTQAHKTVKARSPARTAPPVKARSVVTRLEKDRTSSDEADKLRAEGHFVYFRDQKLSGHILRQQPNGVVEEVEMTKEGRIHVLGKLRARASSTVGDRRTQRGR